MTHTYVSNGKVIEERSIGDEFIIRYTGLKLRKPTNEERYEAEIRSSVAEPVRSVEKVEVFRRFYQRSPNVSR